ncbi:MAG: DNA-deoxyinosine glycosylase [Ruminococcaceae bacterium]|nr:DNA-deoxyinosine glycosylase [Oscillospiraceae bacterium]
MPADEEGIVCHPFAPICGLSSRILILGSMPSVHSRQQGYYYGHPQNRFWPLLAYLFQADQPQDDAARHQLIVQNNLALWDVLQQCRIKGSADSSIKAAKANPVDQLLGQYPIIAVFANGQTAARLYKVHLEPLTGLPIKTLPSTSPANARFTLEHLADAWQEVKVLASRPYE